MTRGRVLLVAGLLLLPVGVSAQASVELDAAAAQRIVAGCAEHAEGRGQSHAIAVVDGS